VTTNDQPWLANPEWAQKRISGTTASNVEQRKFGWLYGSITLALGAVGLALKGDEIWGSPSFLFLLIFPAIGIALLWWNLLLTARAHKYAGTYFEMDSLPFLLGQKLSGRIHTRLGSRWRGPVQITLNCVRRRKSADRGVTGASKITWDELVWRGEQLCEGVESNAASESTTLPVEFSLPPDAPTTSSTNRDDRILWQLRASAKFPGVNFLQYFEVPVFTSAGISTRPAYGDRDFYAPVSIPLTSHPPVGDRQVVERPSPGGGLELLFLANRHRGIAKFATVAFCLWTAAIWYFFRWSDFLSLSLFVSGDLLLLYWALWAWFSTASARLENGFVTGRNSLFGIGKSKRVAYIDIQQVTSPIAGQSGQGTEAIPAYAIYLQTSSQGTVTLATGLRNAGEAGYVVEKIKAQIGMPPSKSPSKPIQ